MRKLWILAVLAICSLAGIQIAAAQNFAPVVPAAHHGQLVAAPTCGCEAPAATACNTCGGCNQCCDCNGGGKHCGGLCGLFSHGGCHGGHCGHHRHDAYDRSSSFHCGCNGSYKFPVPPLSTYHWPGMYSHQLMTDYHSPWRFPPIKPYVDEVPLVEMGADGDEVQRFYPASVSFPVHTAALPTGESESMSAKMLRLGQ